MNQVKRYTPEQIHHAGMTTITAHSACEGTAPNSREHILAAIASGAEFIEIDVRSDGEQLYLSHDLPQDFSSCVTFETLLELISPYPTLFVNCDVKTEGLLKPIMAAAARYHMVHRILFTGQCNADGKEIKALGGTLWHSLWYSPDFEDAIKRAVVFCKETGCTYINLDKRMVNEANIDYVQANGLNYSVWTPGEEKMLRFLLKKRVANITTREPLLALRLRHEIQGTPEENVSYSR